MTILHQRDTVAGLVARVARLRAEADALETLGAAEREATPPGGGWSVGQVLDHLAISNEEYLVLIRRLMERGSAMPPAPGHATWKPRLVAGFLWRSLAKEGNRLPAPKQIRPRSAPADALARYQASLSGFDALLPATTELPWNALVGRSPLSTLVRPNLGDALMTVVVHCERHHRQIARVRAALGGAATGKPN
jgi:hypothetical protein